MFHNPLFHSGTIVSDEGYCVKLLTRYSLVYEEGPVSVSFEKDSIPGQMDVFLSSARSVGIQAIAVSSGPALQDVLEKVKRALEWKGFGVRFIAP